MDGFEVACRLRSSPTSAKTLIVAMSGYGRPKDIETARDAGIDEYLVKPLDIERLNALIGGSQRNPKRE
ncbi:MAG: response regulator [Verrucomicrobiales bacterium]